jgi:hypothetical protein
MSLSVVVTVVDGGETLARCLTSLATQQGGPSLEVIVPWDDSVPGMESLAARFPTFRFLPSAPWKPSVPSSGPPGNMSCSTGGGRRA